MNQSRRQNQTQARGKFVTPYINSRYIFPLILISSAIAVYILNRQGLYSFFRWESWDLFQHKIPLMVFDVGILVLGVYCFIKKFSLIPILGLSSCAYLMTELGITNWIRFGGWLIVGFCIYFTYGIRHSKLRARQPHDTE